MYAFAIGTCWAPSSSSRPLFLCPHSGSYTGMDESLKRIIRQALEEARAKGRDYLTQTQVAVEAGRQARPDLTASEILATVRRLQQP